MRRVELLKPIINRYYDDPGPEALTEAFVAAFESGFMVGLEQALATVVIDQDEQGPAARGPIRRTGR